MTSWEPAASTWEPAPSSFEAATSGGFDTWHDENTEPRTLPADDGVDAFADLNIQDGDAEGKPEYTGCRFCKSMEHKGRECPDKPADFGLCFICKEEGHTRKECPNKPPASCKLCREIGHELADCPVNRLWAAYKIDGDTEAMTAYNNLKKADKTRDLDEVKHAAFVYAKSYPGLTIVDLENMFREEKMNTYLIAKEQTLALTFTAVNFQGEAGQKFVACFQFSAKPRRAKQDAGWPADAEENTARLAEAGFLMDSFVTVCRNCGEGGHSAKSCAQDKVEVEKIKVECTLCNGEGHRARDCKEPRRQHGKPKECRNCGSTEHIAKDCDQAPPPRACRNCDSTEHLSKECDQPKDWSRVTCDNCGEKGHGRGRCKAPPKDDDGANHEVDEDTAADEGHAATDNNGGW